MTRNEQPTIVIIDGQGGGVGKSIAERLLKERIKAKIIVVGANAVATSNMMKAGPTAGATGENACIYNCAQADIIVGPIGIIFPNAMHGEISAAMALAVAQSKAHRVLIPVPNSHLYIAGLQEHSLTQYLDDAVRVILDNYG